MKEVLKEFNNIEKNIRRNNFTVFMLILLVFAIIITFAVTLFKLNKHYYSNRMVIDTGGRVYESSTLSPSEVLTIEIKDFFWSFYDNYYSFNQYNIEENINNGLFCGDASLKNLYYQYKNDGWYNVVIEQGVEQVSKIPVDGFFIDISSYPYKVSVSGIMTIRKDKKVRLFSLSGTCTLTIIDKNFPKNPHGFFINNWVESKYKLDNE